MGAKRTPVGEHWTLSASELHVTPMLPARFVPTQTHPQLCTCRQHTVTPSRLIDLTCYKHAPASSSCPPLLWLFQCVDTLLTPQPMVDTSTSKFAWSCLWALIDQDVHGLKDRHTDSRSCFLHMLHHYRLSTRKVNQSVSMSPSRKPKDNSTFKKPGAENLQMVFKAYMNITKPVGIESLDTCSSTPDESMCQGSNTSDTSSAQRSNSNKIWSDCVLYCQVGDSVSLGRKTYLQNSLPSRDHLNDPWPHLLRITQQQTWAKSHEKPNLLLVFFKQWL